MSNGLFTVFCPRCGTEVAVGEGTAHQCSTCGRRYLLRMGYLLPIERQGALGVSGPCDAARFDRPSIVGDDAESPARWVAHTPAAAVGRYVAHDVQTLLDVLE